MTVPEIVGKTAQEIFSKIVPRTRKVGNVPLSADIPVSITGDTAITVTNTGTASAIGYSVAHNASGVTAGSKGDTTNQTPGFGGTFKALSATVDAKGHVTTLAEHTVKAPDTEATQSVKGLMSAADKEKLDTLIDGTLSNAGKAADAKATGDKITALESENALLRELVNGIDAPIYRTKSGNPATFSDGAAANVKALSVTITPAQSGSGDPSPSNIRPISGVTSVSVGRTKKNLWPHGDKTVTLMTGYLTFTPPLPAGTYTLSADVAETGTHLFLCNEGDGEATVYLYLQNSEANTRVSAVKKIDVPVKNVNIYSSWDYDHSKNKTATYRNIQFESENAATAYEPYQGQSVTVSLVDSNGDPLTVYGGTLDVTTGELTVTWGDIASYNGESLPGVWMSDRDVYAAGTSPTAGAQVVYELATPVTYQLTPAQIATLSGYNAVFSADAGALSVTYRANPALTLGGD